MVHTRKDTQPVAFGEILDLSRFVDNEASLRYQLLAVVHHKGTLARGHYISVTRTPQGEWQCQNDHKVAAANLKDATNPRNGFTPYLLFWRKIPVERAQYPSSSKKRSREEAASTLQNQVDRRGSKSPRIDIPIQHDSHASSSRGSRSSLPWPLKSLYGQNGYFGKAQEIEEELSECRKEHERKNQQMVFQRDLIQRAALSHTQLVGTIGQLDGALDASLQATAIVTPFMRNLQARGEKNRGTAIGYLELEERARMARAKALGRFVKNEHMARLLQGGLEDNGALRELKESVSEAVAQDALENWLDEEFWRSGLPSEE